MSGNDMDMAVANPVPVEIKNYADFYAKPKVVQRTTLKTYVIDGGVEDLKRVQIADYEPSRLRMVVQVIDGPVAITTEVPVTSPDLNAAGTPPQGRHLPASQNLEYVFLGPDAFWLNSVATGPTTRVTVTKEYC